MDVDTFVRQVQALQRRVTALNRRAIQEVIPDILTDALDELQNAIEYLEQAQGLIHTQQQAMTAVQFADSQERLSMQDVFNDVPIAYVITGLDGTIRRLNQSAVCLLNQTERFLIGKPLSLFVPEGERRALRAEFERLSHLSSPEMQMRRLQPYNGRPLDAIVIVAPSCNKADRPIALHWLVRPASEPHIVSLPNEREQFR